MERVSFTQEFIFRASPSILYQFLTTPNCLIRWFCDKVDITKEVYTFMPPLTQSSWQAYEKVIPLIFPRGLRP